MYSVFLILAWNIKFTELVRSARGKSRDCEHTTAGSVALCLIFLLPEPSPIWDDHEYIDHEYIRLNPSSCKVPSVHKSGPDVLMSSKAAAQPFLLV